MRLTTRLAAVGLAAALLPAGCGGDDAGNGPRPLRIFHAAGLTPLIETLREEVRRDRGLDLRAEGSGSQEACRKLAELGRQCDLLLLADAGLVTRLLQPDCPWRLDFAADEVVLGVGARAPDPGRAEADWAAALAAPGVRLGRVDETQAPMGYRTLMVWQLQERAAGGPAGLAERLRSRCLKVVDDVGRLCPLLKAGELDYAFLYRSTCIAHDIRYIELDPAINLGDPDRDYSGAAVSFSLPAAGDRRTITVTGAPITWTLCLPARGADREAALDFARYLLEQSAALDRHGFRPLAPPRFYGPRADFAALPALAEFARYAGELE